jgi:N-acetylglucosamine-6-phosphate deacetylase
MALLALLPRRVFTGEHFVEGVGVLVEGERIVGLVPRGDMPAEASPCPVDGLLAPGWIDAQVNGGGGVLFNAERDVEALRRLAAAHARFGTTAMLPTFITDRPAPMTEAVAAVHAAIGAAVPGVTGIHLEGPFLSVARKGAHDPALIRPLTDADVDLLLDGPVRPTLLTVAVENAAPRLIRRLVDGGIIVSLGHSDAGYEAAMAAADAGARGVTHLFNAMSPFGHRAPGVVGAALDHGGLWGGLIADGFHVHPASLRRAIAAKRGPAKLFLVTDAMPPAASPGDSFMLNGRLVRRTAGRLTLADGTLAGSDLTMDVAVRYAVDHLDVSLGEALRMASVYPAAFLGLDRSHGRIAPGFRADLVALTDALGVEGVWIGGERVAAA